jgi:hypothetical protein
LRADEVGGLRPAGLYDFDDNDNNNDNNKSGYDDDNNNNDDDDNNNVIAYSNDDDDNRSGGGRARSRRPQPTVWGWGFNYCSWFFGGGVFWFFFNPASAGVSVEMFG